MLAELDSALKAISGVEYQLQQAAAPTVQILGGGIIIIQYYYYIAYYCTQAFIDTTQKGTRTVHMSLSFKAAINADTACAVHVSLTIPQTS